MRLVIGGWVALVTGLAQDKLLWSDQNQPRPSKPYVGLTRRTFTPFGFATVTTAEIPVAATATVTAAVAGETVSLILGQLPLVYTLVGADDAEAARDQILAQIAASFEPMIATANGLDKIDVVGKGVGDNSQGVRLSAVEGATVDETLEYRRISQGLRRAIVRVSLFGFSTDGADLDVSPDEYADALVSSLMDAEEPGTIYLDQHGVGVENQASINEQNVSVSTASPRGTRESRLIFDVQFNAAARRFFPANAVESFADPIIEVAA